MFREQAPKRFSERGMFVGVEGRERLLPHHNERDLEDTLIARLIHHLATAASPSGFADQYLLAGVPAGPFRFPHQDGSHSQPGGQSEPSRYHPAEYRIAVISSVPPEVSRQCGYRRNQHQKVRRMAASQAIPYRTLLGDPRMRGLRVSL